MPVSTVYLIPIALYDDETAMQCIPSSILDAIVKCNVFFVENERTARRFLKKLSKNIVIDDYEWNTITEANTDIENKFLQALQLNKTIGIMSEAGCPGIADPGKELVKLAHEKQAKVIPLVGPNSIILALMASGMNGQCFQFVGYLPVESNERKKRIIELENESIKKNCTQIFIETPYRNNQLLNDILSVAKPETGLCIAADITSANEFIQTKTIKLWKQNKPELHKRPVIFLLYAGKI